jgi:hypothetical protein
MAFEKTDPADETLRRRDFLKYSVQAVAIPFVFDSEAFKTFIPDKNMIPENITLREKSVIGAYGAWAASLLKPVPPLSFRSPAWKDVATWNIATTDWILKRYRGSCHMAGEPKPLS